MIDEASKHKLYFINQLTSVPLDLFNPLITKLSC